MDFITKKLTKLKSTVKEKFHVTHLVHNALGAMVTLVCTLSGFKQIAIIARKFIV